MTVLAVRGGWSDSIERVLSADLDRVEVVAVSTRPEGLRLKSPLRFEGDLGRLDFDGDEPKLVRPFFLVGDVPSTAFAFTGIASTESISERSADATVDGEVLLLRKLVLRRSFSKIDLLGVLDGSSVEGSSAIVTSLCFSERLVGVATDLAKVEGETNTGVRSSSLADMSCSCCSRRSSMKPRVVGSARLAPEGTSLSGDEFSLVIPALMKGDMVVQDDARGGVGGSDKLLCLKAGWVRAGGEAIRLCTSCW